MASTISELLSRIEIFQYNPALIQKTVLDHLSSVTNGTVDIVDPTSPFTFTMESSAVLASAAMSESATNTRRQYPVMSLTQEDLYYHMSDKDYVGRFAMPGSAVITIAIAKEELLNRMLLDPSGIYKVVIPRNTVFSVAGIPFSLQYPVEIRQLTHGGIQVVYDSTIVSPLYELDTNIIDSDFRTVNSLEWLVFDLKVHQFAITSQTFAITTATVFNQTMPYLNEFYCARAYLEQPNGSWVEVKVTHSDKIYDLTELTIVLRVYKGQLNITIPQIYLSTGLATSRVRIDLYTTLGLINFDLGAYPDSSFQANWLAIDESRDRSIYTAAMASVKSYSLFSEHKVTGGSMTMPFEQLRKQVIENTTGVPVIPITGVQLQAVLNRKGYEVVCNVDTITNRIFLATKSLPPPSNNKLITASASSIHSLIMSYDSAVKLATVIDNGPSITFTPDTIYQFVSGQLQLVPTAKVKELLALPPDKRALAVTKGSYFYSPFHYVLDASGIEFDARPYYLDGPKAITKHFVSSNDSTLLEVGTGSFNVVKTGKGYELTIMTKSGDSVKALHNEDLHVQLAFVPPGEKDRAYLNGTLFGIDEVTKERIYKFDLSSTFNVNTNNRLELKAFTMYNTEKRITAAELTTDFDIIYSTSSTMPSTWLAGAVDSVLGRHLLPLRTAGIANESIRLRFGYYLKSLWSRSRSLVSAAEYQSYPADVPATYDSDIYRKDPVTGSIMTFHDGKPVYNLEHAKGDPIVDESGNVEIRHYAGDIVRGPSGYPILKNERKMLRHFDVMLLEGPYWFATDDVSSSYRDEVVSTLLTWILDDIGDFGKIALEQTRVYFYPKATIGEVDVLVGDGRITKISAGQSLQLDLLVPEVVYRNMSLRKELEKSTVSIINAALQEQTVAETTITSLLRLKYGSDVINVSLNGLGGRGNIPAFTIIADGARASLRKRLAVQPDNTLIVEEDVTCNFIKHALK